MGQSVPNTCQGYSYKSKYKNLSAHEKIETLCCKRFNSSFDDFLSKHQLYENCLDVNWVQRFSAIVFPCSNMSQQLLSTYSRLKVNVFLTQALPQHYDPSIREWNMLCDGSSKELSLCGLLTFICDEGCYHHRLRWWWVANCETKPLSQPVLTYHQKFTIQ